MDPRLDVRGRIAELFASAPRSGAAEQAAWPEIRAASATPRARRVRAAIGGALINAGRALAGDNAAQARSVARR